MPTGPSHPVDLRPSRTDRYLPIVVGVVMVFPTVFLCVAAVMTVRQSPAAGAVVALCAVIMVLLVAVVWREARDRGRTRIRIAGDCVRLTLPRYMDRAPVERDVPVAGLAEVAHREESFRTLGLTTIRQAFALRLADGAWLALGGDKDMTGPFFAHAAAAIAERAGLPIRECGMVEGAGGFLQVVGMRAPDWSAPPMAATITDKRRQGAALTWRIVWGLILLAMLLRALTEIR